MVAAGALDACVEQIEASGTKDYVVIDDKGNTLRFGGSFASTDRQHAAFYVLQHSAAIPRGSEKLKRTVIRFPDSITFVATFVAVEDSTVGVVCQLPAAADAGGDSVVSS